MGQERFDTSIFIRETFPPRKNQSLLLSIEISINSKPLPVHDKSDNMGVQDKLAAHYNIKH